MAPFAQGTEVPVAKTRGEIEALVEKNGAEKFASGWIREQTASISFVLAGRMVRFELPLPTEEDAQRTLKKQARFAYSYPDATTIKKWIEAENRRRWRCLLLAIKAKLEIVASGISTFEEEFLAHIVTGGNLTIYEALKQAESGRRLLPPVDSDVMAVTP